MDVLWEVLGVLAFPATFILVVASISSALALIFYDRYNAGFFNDSARSEKLWNSSGIPLLVSNLSTLFALVISVLVGSVVLYAFSTLSFAFTVFLDAYFIYALVTFVLRVRREIDVERFFRERRGVG